MEFEVQKLDNQNTITIKSKDGSESITIQYQDDTSWYGRDDENGFRYVDNNGNLLNKEQSIKADAVLVEALKTQHEKIQAELTKVVTNRLHNTDNNNRDAVESGDLENVRRGLKINSILAQRVNGNKVLGALGNAVIFKSINELTSASRMKSDVKKAYEDSFEEEDFKTITATLREANVGEDVIKQIVPQETYKPSAADVEKQKQEAADKLAADQAAADAEAKADQAKQERDQKVQTIKANNLFTHHTIETVEDALGIRNANGTLDTGTEAKIQEHVESTLDTLLKDGNSILDANGAGVKNQINFFNPTTKQQESYQFIKSHDKNGHYTYNIQAVGEDKLPIPGTLSQPIDVSDKTHPALTALYSRMAVKSKEKLNAYYDRTAADEAKIAATTNTYLKSINQEDLSEDIISSIKDRTFSADALKKKLGKETSDKDLDTYLAVITGLMLKPQPNENTLNHLESQHNTADAMFKMFSFMGTGEEYDPQADQALRDGLIMRDNILGLEAYDILKRMDHGDHIKVSQLYDANNEEQMNKIKAHFDGQDTVSREDVLKYVRQEHDNYAIRVLSGKDEAAIAKMSPEDRATWLSNVTDAMYGNFERDGTPVIFAPFWPDVDLLQKSFGRPELSDPAYQKDIQYHREYGNHIPDGKDAMSTLNKDEQAALFNATRDITGVDAATKYEDLSDSDKQAHLNQIVSERRPELYGNAEYNKVVANYYEDIGGQFIEHRSGLPLRDANGLIIFDQDGQATWTEGSFNDTYGGPSADEFALTYIRYNRFEVEDMYGTEAAKIFFHGNPSNIDRNEDITYKEILEHLNGVNPQLAERFERDVRSMGSQTVFTDFRILEEQYQSNRAIMANQQKNNMLEAQYQVNMDNLNNEEVKPTNETTTTTTTTATAELSPEQQKAMKAGNYALDVTDQGSNTIGSKAPIGAVIGASVQKLSPTFNSDASTPPRKFLPIVYEGSAITAPTKWTLFKAGAADITTGAIKTITKGAKAIPLAGTVVGGGLAAIIAAAEANAIENKLPALIEAGLADKELKSFVTSNLADYILQSSLDPSIIGGELVLKDDQNKIVEKFQLDSISKGMILPDLLIDMLSQDSATTQLENYRQTKQLWTESNINLMHKNITRRDNISQEQLDHYGLKRDPKTNDVTIAVKGENGKIVQLPLGIVLRDQDAAEMFLDRVQTGVKRGTKNSYVHIADTPIYDEKMKAVVDNLLQINEMAGFAIHEVQTADLSLIVKNNNGSTFAISYASSEQIWGDAHNENGFKASIDSATGKEPLIMAATRGKYTMAPTLDLELYNQYQAELHDALMANERQVKDHMKAVLRERLFETDGDLTDKINIDDLEKIRDGFIMNEKINSIQNVLGLQALHELVAELKDHEIIPTQAQSFMKLKDGDQAMWKESEDSIQTNYWNLRSKEEVSATSVSALSEEFKKVKDPRSTVKDLTSKVTQQTPVKTTTIDNSTIAANEPNNVDTALKPA